jgi:hypothetical protein
MPAIGTGTGRLRGAGAAAEGWINMQALPKGFNVLYGRQEMALHQIHQGIARRIGMPLPETETSKTFRVQR